MRDIGSRIGRYRLIRYARNRDAGRASIRWLLACLALWVLWATTVSDHSMLRIWKLHRERSAVGTELARVQREHEQVDASLETPAARKALAERRLREESGMARAGEIVYRIRGDIPDSTARP